jgi:uncharacterized protein (TIGR03084 family)
MTETYRPDLPAVLADLTAEREDLMCLLRGLGPDGWAALTPAEPWTVRHQLVHLGFFDRMAALAVTDALDFAAERARALDDLPAYEARSLVAGPAGSGPELLWWWRQGAAEFDFVVAGRDGSVRVPWFGPEMALRSLVWARLMETWAHGQDVADTLGVGRTPTDRLRHVAALAVRARPYAYTVRGLRPPAAPVRVELTAPSGEEWVFNPEGIQHVRGTALEFCLVLTRRRHVADTGLVADGPLAREWLEIGQAYAGPPGAARRPGQFRSLGTKGQVA